MPQYPLTITKIKTKTMVRVGVIALAIGVVSAVLSAFGIRAQRQPVLGPDLVVVAHSWKCAGGPTSYVLGVKNQGTAAIPANTPFTLRVEQITNTGVLREGGTAFFQYSTPSFGLDPGNTAFFHGLISGDDVGSYYIHGISAKVDDGNVITELNENNNTAVALFGSPCITGDVNSPGVIEPHIGL